MNDAVKLPDLDQRERALDPSGSFIVQAPAGSGKTELLIQRFLALLARVERPEEIAAITFTIKAAAEMRGRIFEALGAARNSPRPDAPHDARTWDLALCALRRNDELGWKLEESADRLRVQTIDALCASLTRQMPVLSRFGAQPESLEDASALYAAAARGLLARLEQRNDAAADVERLLEHLDNNAAEAERLLADMLMRRDHWIRTLLRQPKDRRALEAALEEVRAAAAKNAHALYPGERKPAADDVAGWEGFVRNELLTEAGKWRSKPITEPLRDNETLRAALRWVQRLPPATYEDSQWEALETIVRLAPHAIAELQWVFALRGQADFVEVAQGALRALGNDEAPTDLMLALDYRVRHILVDEFQDTSFTQFELLEKLTSGWEQGDGRTLFLVGDPMQSIYRFREAEVGLFLRAWEKGIGTVRLDTLTLSSNFRSQAGIVAWVNEAFGAIMPAREDVASGAVKYARSEPVHGEEAAAVAVHPFYDEDRAGEAECIARIAREAQALPTRDGRPATVAILVRSRTHLAEVMPCLRRAKLPFRAIEIEQLGHRPVVQDLLALARAISHAGDRTAWIAVLRAPWCGLTLADLLVVAEKPDECTIREGMRDEARIARLSGDGRARLAATREVLARALAQRRRSSLREAVEGAWLALGGPACVESETDLEDAEIFLDHLEQNEDSGAIPDLAAFEASLAKLFALPDLGAPECLQVMTIHKAKGLEFDTVIVPGLGSGTASDEKKLFMWMETPRRNLLLAPVNPSGSEDDPVYKFIGALDREKEEHENARLLYVAATRARQRLHLLGDVEVGAEGEVKDPKKGSLLAKLWPVVKPSFAAPQPRPPAERGPAVPAERQARLRRLAAGSVRFETPPAVAWSAPPERESAAEIEFSWAGDTARRVGSVVHRWLQRIAAEEAKDWTRKRVAASREAMRRELVARGVVERDVASACDRVAAALTACLEDPRGRWLLGPQRNARNEYRLSTVSDGVRRLLVIDRMFEDDVGDTWIVDYKTSTHEGADVAAFLASEEERYREQVERYAAAAGVAGARRGLYFPLLKGWREWT